jgi:hypothetical protein
MAGRFPMRQFPWRGGNSQDESMRPPTYLPSKNAGLAPGILASVRRFADNVGRCELCFERFGS